jgi:uncharacterized membrane protein
MEKTTLGLEENIEALLAYAVFFISGITLLVLEKENKFVHFHALQSTLAFLILFSIHIVLFPLLYVPFLNILVYIVYYVLDVVSIVVWIVCMFQAYKGERYKLPIIGNIIERTL